MNPLILIELAVSLLLVIGVVTQIAIPLWRGTPLFPIFRAERRLEREVAEARQRRLEADLEELRKREEGGSTPGKLTP